MEKSTFANQFNNVILLSNSNKKNELKYRFECTLKFCDISSLLYIDRNTNMNNKKNGIKYYDVSFQLYFKNDKLNNIILFHRIGRGHYRYPLVPCPYINWMNTNKMVFFKPSHFVKDEFPRIVDDKNRHRYIPVFNREETELGDGFICGEIIQGSNLPPIKVGFGLQQGLNMEINTLNVIQNNHDKEEYTCRNESLESKYVFVYSDKKYNPQNQQASLRLFKKGDEIYSGDILFVYSEVATVVARFKNYNKSKDYDELYFNKEYTGYDPISACTVEDFDVEYRLKIGSVTQKPIKSKKIIGKAIESYDIYRIPNDLIKDKQFISCQIVKSSNDTPFYNNFYSKRFKTFINKIQNLDGQDEFGNKYEKIIIENNISKIYGKYKCDINNSTKFEKIKESHIIIVLPEIFKINYSNSDNDASLVNCPQKDIKLDNLVMMNVIIIENNIILSNITNLEDKRKFGKDKNGNIFYLIKNDINMNKHLTIVVTCLYGNDNLTKFTIEKTIEHNKNSINTEDSYNLMINIVCGWIILFLTIAFIIILKVILKIRKEDKKDKNMFSCSQSDSSTVSETANVTTAKIISPIMERQNLSMTMIGSKTTTNQQSTSPKISM